MQRLQNERKKVRGNRLYTDCRISIKGVGRRVFKVGDGSGKFGFMFLMLATLIYEEGFGQHYRGYPR